MITFILHNIYLEILIFLFIINSQWKFTGLFLTLVFCKTMKFPLTESKLSPMKNCRNATWWKKFDFTAAL